VSVSIMVAAVFPLADRIQGELKNSDFRASIFKPLFCELLAIYLVGPSLC